MQQIDFTKNGGFPTTQNTFNFLQDSYRQPLLALANLLGNKVIVEGVNVGGNSVSGGWIVYNGELIKFTACANNAYVKISESLLSVEFEDGLTKAVYKVKTAICDAVSGDFAFADLVRLESYKELQTKLNNHIENAWRTGDVKEVHCTVAYYQANFDSTGLGINERVGWHYCNGNNGTWDKRDKTSICWDNRTIDPNNNYWDLLYNQLGLTVGEKKHQLTQAQLPSVEWEIKAKIQEGGGGHNGGYSEIDPNATDTNNFTTPTGLVVNVGGNDEKFSIVQPSIISLFIQKI
jgi:hypothetical protein